MPINFCWMKRFIYSKPRSGYYVSDIQALPIVNTNDYQISNINEEKSEPKYKYAFNLAEIDAEYFPFIYLENTLKKYSKIIS